MNEKEVNILVSLGIQAVIAQLFETFSPRMRKLLAELSYILIIKTLQ